MTPDKIMIYDLEKPCKDHGRTRSLAPGGYALVGWPGRRSRSTGLHRKILAETLGVSLESLDGWVIRHRCDNPRCVEPTHLVLGTKADNNRDRAERKRSATEVPSRQRLTKADCAAIRRRYNPTRKSPDGAYPIARDYGVDAAVIYRVIRGEYVASR